MENRYRFITSFNNHQSHTDCDLETVLEKLYIFKDDISEISVIDLTTNKTYNGQESIIDLLNQETPIYRAVVFNDDLMKSLSGFYCTYQSLEQYATRTDCVRRIELYNRTQNKLICEGNPITFMSKLKTVLEMSDPLVDVNTCVPPSKRVEFDIHEGFTKLANMIKNGGDSTEILELITVLKYFSTKD